MVDLSKSPIQMDDKSVPYIVTKRKELICQHGKDYNKANNDKKARQIPKQVIFFSVLFSIL